MGAAKQYNVVIVGAGITGLAVAHHLRQAGVDKVALVDADASAAASACTPGYLSGGLLDNFTRISNAHQSDFAAELWRFGDLAFDAVVEFCAAHQVVVARGQRLRWITSVAELREAEVAVRQMQAAGFAAQLCSRGERGITWDDYAARVMAVQIDGDRSAAVDPSQLLAALREAAAAVPLLERVEAVTTSDQVVTLNLVGGEKLHTQMLVLANHLAIGDLLPSMRAALVSYADQWATHELPKAPPPTIAPGSFVTAHHTHEWGVFHGPTHVRWGGGRYLRPLGGYEATAATYERDIEQHLQAQLAKNIPCAAGGTTARGGAVLDCRPCDELPVIGPMFGEDRILLATGYMGLGLTFGFLAGKCLAQLIAKGKSPLLPERLWPRRLRSL